MEIHILIVWNKANIDNSEIIRNLPPCLSILKQFIYSWDEKLAKENFAAFYGENLEDIQYKIDHCGAGVFRVFLLSDSNPYYSERTTSGGKRVVNTNLFDLKAKLRELTGGGHLIHASDTCTEADLNCMSLFGMLTNEAYNHDFGDFSDNVIHIRRNITGSTGWLSWNDLLYSINKVTPYVVLRNVETIIEDSHDIHGDTDLLVENRQSAIAIAAAQKEMFGVDRVLYHVTIDGKKQLIDFRHLQDGYYCEEWEREILDKRISYKKTSLFVMDIENYTYTLLYHGLVHKPVISEDYKRIFMDRFGIMDRYSLTTLLEGYMEKKGFAFSKPKDPSVFIHPDYYSKIPISISKKIINTLKVYKYKKGGYEKTNTSSKTFLKVLYRGCHMGISLLRKTKATIRRIFYH